MSAKSSANCYYNSDRKHNIKGTQCDQPEAALWGTELGSCTFIAETLGKHLRLLDSEQQQQSSAPPRYVGPLTYAMYSFL